VTRSRSQITESQSAVSALERDGGRLQLPFHPRRPWQPQERPQVIRIRGGWTCWQKPHGFEPPHVAESKSGATWLRPIMRRDRLRTRRRTIAAPFLDDQLAPASCADLMPSSIAACTRTRSLRDRTAPRCSRSIRAQVGSTDLRRRPLPRPFVRHCASNKNFLGLDAPGPTLAAELDG
jgi:hypothetical protein